MIRDLDLAAATETAVVCDVLIVGAGIAGILLAVELSSRGLRVVVVESGGASQDAETHVLNRVVQTGQVYAGAESGRFRCLGGTSTRWGGAMMPFQPEDLGPHTAGWDADWPIRLTELLPYLPKIEAAFSLPTDSYDTPEYVTGRAAEAATAFIVRAAKWPPFKSRNVARVFDAPLRAAGGPEVWLNATVTRFGLDAQSRISSIQAVGRAGKSLTIEAADVVVAAGAIESTRLLLKLDADHDGRLFAHDDIMGRYFHDHLSAPVAEIEVTRPKEFRRLVGFRFQGAAMRNTRFELTGPARAAHRLPGAFAHVGFSTDGASGFDGLRDVLRALQRRRLPNGAALGMIAKDADWFGRAAWSRVVHQRVLPPDQARYELHLVTEQQPMATNRITLSADERDGFGIPLASIEWRVSSNDVDTAQSILDALIVYWRSSSLADIGELIPYTRQRWSGEMVSGGGIYHPGGSLRMGASARDGVVDGRLRSFAVGNLRVLSTAVFPSGGGANPTLMLMLMALRLADDLSIRNAPRFRAS